MSGDSDGEQWMSVRRMVLLDSFPFEFEPLLRGIDISDDELEILVREYKRSSALGIQNILQRIYAARMNSTPYG